MAFGHAAGAGAGHGAVFVAFGVSQFYGDDAGRYGQRAPAHQHHKGGDQPPERGGRGNVAVADGGHGGNRPINGGGDAGVAVFPSFHQIHDGAHDDGNNHDE